MKLEKFKQLLNDEFVACYNQQIVREQKIAKLTKTVEQGDDLAAIPSNPGCYYGITYMVQVWEEVKKAKNVGEAVKAVAKQHVELTKYEPAPTTSYQYACIVKVRLAVVLQKALTQQLLGPEATRQVEKYLKDDADAAIANRSTYSFGTLHLPNRQQVFSQSEQKQEAEQTKAKIVAPKPNRVSAFNFGF